MDRAKHQNRIKKALWSIFGLFLYLVAGNVTHAQVSGDFLYVNLETINATLSPIPIQKPFDCSNTFVKTFWWLKGNATTTADFAVAISCAELSSTVQDTIDYFNEISVTNIKQTYGTTSGYYYAYVCETGSLLGGYDFDDCLLNNEIVNYIEVYFNGQNTYTVSSPQGTSTPTVPIQKNINIIKPTYGTTTPTTTVVVQVSYKTPFSLDFRPTTTRYYEIVDALTGELNFSYSHILNANSAENITISATNTVPIGSKYIRAMYLDEFGGIYSEVDEIFFNVATNTYFQATGLLSPRDDTSGLTQIDCGFFEFGCQFQRALVFLFIPAQDKLDNFSNIWQTIAEKKPFGYVTVTINQLENLTATGTPDFDLGTIPFMDEIFSPFRTLLGGILWGVFALFFVRVRLSNLDI